jgi:putative polyhydroxyalkanoate system protein
MTPDVSVSKEHKLGREAAKAKVNAMADQLAQKHGLTVSRTETGVTIAGGGLQGGAIIVTDTTVVVEICLPFFAKPMKGLLEKGIRDALDTHLA